MSSFGDGATSTPAAQRRLTPFGRKRLLVSYRRATDNEIAVDVQAARYAGTSPDRVGYIPRPGLWLGKAGMRPALSRTLSAVVGLGWRWTAGLPFHLLKTLQLTRHWRAVRDQRVPAGETRFGLALSRRAMEVISPLSLSNPPTTWIVPPWVDAEGLGAGRTLVDGLALLTTADLREALRLALAATHAMARDRRRARWVLQTYTALPWFCLRLALEKLDGDLFMAEHFDRWAVLADELVGRKRLPNLRHKPSIATSLTLVQHGVVAGLGDTDGGGIGLPRRLGAVSDLYVYDEQSEQIFRRHLLTPSCGQQVQAHLFQPVIALLDLPPSTAPRILFVGHPVCAQLHVAVYKALAARGPIEAYYKPHPAAGSADICRQQSWTMLDNRSGFPRVDLLIAYPSTLVKEYAMHDIAAVVHPINADAAIADEIVTSAVAELSKISTPSIS